MPSDQTVTAKAVLAAVIEIRRHGTRPALEHLEQVEPDLSEYLMESLSEIHQKLRKLHSPAAQVQRLYRDVESLTLVCIVALRRGHHDLWRQDISQDADS